MFSTLPPLSHNAFHSLHCAPVTQSPLSSSPLRSSPLRPSPNSGANFGLPSPSPVRAKQTRQCNDGPYSARQTKKNPLIHRSGGDNGRETRRNLFLRRVKQDSEDKRWERRGGDDEIMRTLWIAEQNSREASRAREAQACSGIEQEEDLDDAESSATRNANSTWDEDMVNEVAQQESDEIEALLSMLESESWDPPPNQSMDHEEHNTPYGSDDEEYDQLFMEIGFDEVDGDLSSQPVQLGGKVDFDMMDMS